MKGRLKQGGKYEQRVKEKLGVVGRRGSLGGGSPGKVVFLPRNEAGYEVNEDRECSSAPLGELCSSHHVWDEFHSKSKSSLTSEQFPLGFISTWAPLFQQDQGVHLTPGKIQISSSSHPCCSCFVPLLVPDSDSQVNLV